MSKCDLGAGGDDDLNAWSYCPKIWAAVVFAALFGLTTMVHTYQAARYRKTFCWTIIAAGLFETIGFALRAYSAHQISGLWHYITQLIMIALAPIWVNAFIYMVAGRMIYFLLPSKTIFGIHARKLTLMFVLLDLFALNIQSASSSLFSSSTPSTVQLGAKLFMVGISIQEAFIVLFTILAIRFQHQLGRLERHTPVPYPWRRLLYSIYAGLSFITIRIIYRLIENAGGEDTYVATHEVFLYCLEAVPMLASLLLFNAMHPALVLVGPESEFEAVEGERKWYFLWLRPGSCWKKSKGHRRVDSMNTEGELTALNTGS